MGGTYSSSCRDTVHANLWVSLFEPAQQNYSAFDRELFAVYMGISRFRCMLEDWNFTVFTDHKPLMHAISCIFDPWTACQCRQLAYIAEYTSDTQHVSGVINMVSDTLSRPPEHVTHATCRVHLHIRSLLAAIVLEIASGLHLCSSDQVHSHQPLLEGAWGDT